MDSEAMRTIRAIRDKNSERHLKMTLEERKKEEEQVLKRFAEKTGKPVKIINKS